MNFVTGFIPKIMQKNGKQVIFDNLGMPGHTQLKL